MAGVQGLLRGSPAAREESLAKAGADAPSPPRLLPG